MGTSISLGDYEPEKIPEPWEEYQYRDLSRAYYTQSISIRINGLFHCITALTSLELNKCYTDPVEKGEYLSTTARNCYLSALTIYMDNKGRIIKGEKVLTQFKLKSNNGEHILDSSFKVRKQMELCVDKKELHNHVIKNKQITFRNGKIYSLKKFHEYIIQASICNRRTDVNYTNLKVTGNRDELNKKLSLLGIAESSVGFVSGKAPVIAETAMKILGLALSTEPQFNLAEYTFPINGPVYLDNKTVIQNYKRENHNGYISSQKLQGIPHEEKRDILEELEEIGLNIK
ncbi:hypothetical protein IRZ71_10020 [Flavobacterium sp. ANB]|uniref:hypothetical protein n=1 Tax=unclassified Flavobacterium TaxID=196869 RepID=UPI0012B7B036|nr:MULTISPECIES: hypothetical protein [unclassified Flavobacterium]MBF4516683.1 hypothetical protein [Flavobacterium sp. ANB]MTD69421.1 hypothetical protein [Flavobacterium sp. LC2016-13]